MHLFFLFLKRYSFSWRKHSFISLFLLFSLAVQALGMAALILTQGFMDGAQGVIFQRYMAHTPHLLLTPLNQREAPLSPSFLTMLKNTPGVLLCQPLYRTQGFFQGDERYQFVQIERIPELTRPRCALDLNFGKNQQATLYLPTLILTPLGLKPRHLLLSLDEVILDPELHQTIQLPFQGNTPPVFTEVRLTLKDPMKAEPIKEVLQPLLPSPWQIKDWAELNRPLFSALFLEKWLMFFGVALILGVASLQGGTSLRLLMVHHQDSVALCHLFGWSRKKTERFFTFLGFIILLAGMVAGLLLASLLIALREPLHLPYLTEVPIRLKGVTLWGIFLLAGGLMFTSLHYGVKGLHAFSLGEVFRAP